jgi:hypothetical protein
MTDSFTINTPPFSAPLNLQGMNGLTGDSDGGGQLWGLVAIFRGKPLIYYLEVGVS